MSYNALYRKYRPSKFSDVSGQTKIVATLKNAVKNEKISHAYLFYGPKGTGKTSIAKLLGNLVNCENVVDSEPCGKCEICLQIVNKQYSDIIEIDAASNNGVDEIREIRNKVDLVPTNGKYKIYIIDEVHMLSQGAFNALLKTLEEPPKHIIFILATTEIIKVPETIISRCQSFEFKKISQKGICERLQKIAETEKIKIDEDALDEIALLSKGSLRDAIGLLDQLSVFESEKISSDLVHEVNGTISAKKMNEFLDKIFQNDLKALFVYLDDYEKEGKDIYKIVERLLLELKNILFDQNYFTRNNFDKNKKREIIELIELFNDLLVKMKKSDYPRLLLDVSLIKLCEIKNENTSIIESSQKENKNNLRDDKIVETKIDKEEKNSLINKIGEEVTPSVEKSKEEIKTEKKAPVDNFLEEETKQEEKPEEIKKEITDEEIAKLKSIRINNTLALADKNIKEEIMKKWEKIKDYNMDKEYGSISMLLLDAEVQVASEEYMILTYKYESSTLRANYSIFKIEKLLKKIVGKPYKFIAITYEEWAKIRDQYITMMRKGKKYEIIPEEEEIIKNIKDIDKKNNIGDSLKSVKEEFDESIIEVI